jgi:2-dehydro-3-deoxyglucarate aldolase/4-hydroxy-2-oxoheptanedioate aldolase
MMVMATQFQELLRTEKPLLGTLLSLPSPEIAEVCVLTGFDWLFLDMEHGLLDYAAVQRMIQAVAGRIPCIVRVPTNESMWIGKALDTGADGLIFPHVNSADEAHACVRAAKYPPQGARSVGIARAQAYGTRLREAIANANRDIILIAQAEHVDAVRSIDDILSVPGIDGVFIGPYDLSASLGIPGQVGDPAVREAIGRVRRAAGIAGRPVGILAGSPEAAKAAVADGYKLICLATDTLLLADGAHRLIREAKAGM